MTKLNRMDTASFIHKFGERVSMVEATAAAKFGSATLHEAAGKIGALDYAIRPISPGFRVWGSAVPVLSPPSDNLWLHRAIYAAREGDVLVVNVSGAYEHGYWGEVMSTAAKAQKLAGLVIDGCVRDVELLEEIGFPIFARGLCIRGTGKDFAAVGTIGLPVTFRDVVVAAGDLVVGDRDGVVCIPRSQVPQVIAMAQERAQFEAEMCRRIELGETTLDLFGWN